MIDYDAKAWLRIVLTVRGSVARHLIVRVAVAFVLGLLAVWARQERGVAIPPLAHTLIGVALGLLLVFRTNASYARYVEAREILGRIIDSSRDLARQVATYAVAGPENAAVRHDVHRWLVAFFGLLVHNLREEDRLAEHAERLEAAEIDRLRGARHRCAIVVSWISARLMGEHRAGRLDAHAMRSIDGNLRILVAALGGCERIRRTPIPFAYAQHIKVFLALFCYTVPFAMADALQGYTPVAAAVLAYAMFGIDEIGIEIEDPFGTDPNDLPLDRLEKVVDTSVAEVFAQSYDRA
jgi:ion channel-forming bestrophin family protein